MTMDRREREALDRWITREPPYEGDDDMDTCYSCDEGNHDLCCGHIHENNENIANCPGEAEFCLCEDAAHD